MRKLISYLLIFFGCFVYYCLAHGRMESPPARNTAWRHGFNTPVNYNDVELNCGGVGQQHYAFGFYFFLFFSISSVLYFYFIFEVAFVECVVTRFYNYQDHMKLVANMQLDVLLGFTKVTVLLIFIF